VKQITIVYFVRESTRNIVSCQWLYWFIEGVGYFWAISLPKKSYSIKKT